MFGAAGFKLSYSFRLSEYVVLKLIKPFENMSRNITVDNFFLSSYGWKKTKRQNIRIPI